MCPFPKTQRNNVSPTLLINLLLNRYELKIKKTFVMLMSRCQLNKHQKNKRDNVIALIRQTHGPLIFELEETSH